MGTTEAARRRVRRAPAGTFFRTSDFVGPRPAVLTALSRLHSDGALARVRNGLYWKGVKILVSARGVPMLLPPPSPWPRDGELDLPRGRRHKPLVCRLKFRPLQNWL